MIEYLERIDLLKNLCKKYKLDAYLITSSDEYLNEYVPESKQRLRWLTGFTGSNGIFLYFDKKCYFFTDGRYILQAKSELQKQIKIFESSNFSLFNFLEKKKMEKKILRFDSKLTSIKFVKKIQKTLDSGQIKITSNSRILIDQIFNYPETNKLNEAFLIQNKYASQTALQKIKLIKKKINNFDYYIVTSPESVCWLLNLRGTDLNYTPVVMSRLIILKSGKINLYIDKRKLSNQIILFFKRLKISIFPEDKIYEDIKNLRRNSDVFLDGDSTFFFYSEMKKKVRLKLINDFCKLQKSQKNAAELSNIKNVHVLDAVAMIKFMYWLENEMEIGKISELSVSKKLESFRRENSSFFSLSFPTISATGKNGSIIHYNPENFKPIKLKKGDLYLCDSGAQYYGGTTDITRTFYLGDGKPQKDYVDVYTNVLKGHINLATIKFPKDTLGVQLDTLARQYLWNEGLDYSHGTGHGVGNFLGVHEGPQSISKRSCSEILKEGMVLSNEPGYYKKLKFGIRLENLIFVKKSSHKGFLEFENLTIVPFEKRLINKKLLEEYQIKWINNYHSKVFLLLSKLLETKIKNWLLEKIKPI